MLKLDHITVACDDPDRLATFWETALDGERLDLPGSGDEEMVGRGGEGVALLFKPMAKESTRQMPLHLDLGTDNRKEAVERLCGSGASVRETKREEHGEHTATWTVMEDPDGFCVFEY
jgi:catechol 2,3-dioxygenase-like lactoylglutathione lyase family enzyme